MSSFLPKLMNLPLPSIQTLLGSSLTEEQKQSFEPFFIQCTPTLHAQKLSLDKLLYLQDLLGFKQPDLNSEQTSIKKRIFDWLDKDAKLQAIQHWDIRFFTERDQRFKSKPSLLLMILKEQDDGGFYALMKGRLYERLHTTPLGMIRQYGSLFQHSWHQKKELGLLGHRILESLKIPYTGTPEQQREDQEWIRMILTKPSLSLKHKSTMEAYLLGQIITDEMTQAQPQISTTKRRI